MHQSYQIKYRCLFWIHDDEHFQNLTSSIFKNSASPHSKNTGANWTHSLNLVDKGQLINYYSTFSQISAIITRLFLWAFNKFAKYAEILSCEYMSIELFSGRRSCYTITNFLFNSFSNFFPR